MNVTAPSRPGPWSAVDLNSRCGTAFVPASWACAAAVTELSSHLGAVTEYPSTHPVGEVLVVGQMTGDVWPWLAAWSATDGIPAARQFRDFMTVRLDWSP
jgi:hypothetical protein